MRQNLKSLAPILWGVIIAFIISIFAVWGGSGRLGESRGSNTIVTVGKEKVSADIYIQNLRQRLESMQREFNELDANFIQQLNIPQQVLEQIIQQSVVLQIAKEMGIQASAEEVRAKVKSFPVFQKDGQFVGFDEYQKFLSWNRISPSEFEQSLTKDIIAEKTIAVLTAGMAVTKAEVWENYQKTQNSAKLEYFLIEADKMELAKPATPDELQTFFSENQENYTIPEKRNGTYVFFDTEEIKSQILLDEGEIEQYYQGNLEQFKDPEKIQASRIFLPLQEKEAPLVLAEAQDILNRINQGEDFGALAKSYSQDDKAENNGDWGLYEWKSLTQAEQDQITAQDQGQISEVIELEDGMAIVKTTLKEPAVQKTLAQVSGQIRALLADQKAKDKAYADVDALLQSARKENNLDVAAQKMGYKIKRTGLLKEGDPIDEIDPSGSISRALFMLEEKAVSDPIYTFKGAGLVQLQLTESSRPAAFDEVEAEVAEELNLTRKQELALTQATSLQQEAARRGMETTADRHELEYKTIEEHKKEQYLAVIGENPEVDEIAFSLELNQLSDPVKYENGYIILRVLDRKEVTREDLEDNFAEERDNLLNVERNKFFQSYYYRMRELKGIKPNYELFLRLNSDILSRFER